MHVVFKKKCRQPSVYGTRTLSIVTVLVDVSIDSESRALRITLKKLGLCHGNEPLLCLPMLSIQRCRGVGGVLSICCNSRATSTGYSPPAARHPR